MFINRAQPDRHNINDSRCKRKYDKLIEEGLCVQKRWGEPEYVGKVAASLVKGDFMYTNRTCDYDRWRAYNSPIIDSGVVCCSVKKSGIKQT